MKKPKGFTPLEMGKKIVSSFLKFLKHLKQFHLIINSFSQKHQRCFLSLTGFTLVEILVVLAIVGTMLTFLAPSILKGREIGRRIGCANNLRQIGLAFFMYIEENNDIFPRYLISGTYWQSRINKYINDPKAWVCVNQKNIPYVATGYNLAYAYNYNIGGANTALANIPRKSETVLLSDSTLYSNRTNPFYKNFSICGYYINPSVASFPAERHAGGDNYIFVDGHGKWYSYQEIWTQHGPALGNNANNWWDLR